MTSCWGTPTSARTVWASGDPNAAATSRPGSGWVQAPFGDPIQPTAAEQRVRPASSPARRTASIISSTNDGTGPSSGRCRTRAHPDQHGRFVGVETFSGS